MEECETQIELADHVLDDELEVGSHVSDEVSDHLFTVRCRYHIVVRTRWLT